MARDWIKSIASADAADWLTVSAYLFAALMCYWAAKLAIQAGERSERHFWFAMAILLGLFAVNELLDLQTVLTAVARAHAKAHGWYGGRRAIQFYFVISLVVSAAALAAIAIWLTARLHASLRIALLGFGFIAVFILLRAASFHHVDKVLGSDSGSFNWGSVQEMIGILVIAVGAAIYVREKQNLA